MKPICEYQGCENEAEFLDDNDNKICEDYMVREIEDGSAKPGDFESIETYMACIKKQRN